MSIAVYWIVESGSSWVSITKLNGLLAALEDAAHYHAYLSVCFTFQSASDENHDPPEAVYHQAHALSIINRRLSTPGEQACDGNLAAVSQFLLVGLIFKFIFQRDSFL
jgi:hypothetical protein